jgi:hypothetical protein
MSQAMRAAAFAALAALLAGAPMARAQAVKYLGTITAIAGDTLTVKTDKGDLNQVQVPADAVLKRIAPGQTDLSKATAIEYSTLATGDRVLVTLDSSATGTTPQAARIIAIKQADVTQKRQADSALWNQGVRGLVQSIDPATGTIAVNTRAGSVTKPVTVNTTKATVLKRYAPGSVDFDLAQPAPLDAIHAGDQLWARGTKNADGTAIAADGIVSGTFRSIAGTVISTDTAASTVTVKDLATKKPVSVHLSADTQLRQLDSNIATMVAARLKGGQAGIGAGAGGRPATNGAGNGAASAPPSMPGQPPRGFGQGRPGGNGGGDLESILDRAPAIRLNALKKGDAVMIVATEDGTGINAVKLVAGVEPLLEAPQAQDLLSSWSLSQGGGEGAQ